MRHFRLVFVVLMSAMLGVTFAQEKDKKTEVKKTQKDDSKKDKDAKKDKDKSKDKSDAVEIKWKFEKGKTFYQEMTTNTKQTLKVQGMDIEQNQKQTFYFSWTVKDQDKDNNWILTQKITGLKMDIDIGGQKIVFDSLKKDNNAGNPLADFFNQLVDSEFTITLSPENKVVKVEGRDEFIKKLIKANPQMKDMLEKILSEDALKQMADPAFAVVPGKPVKKGDSWSKTTKLNMGPIGTYETEYKYTYEGKDDKLDKIKVESSLKYSPPGEAGGSLPFEIVKANLTSKDGTGTILFDTEKGRLESSDMSLKLEGKLTIKVGGYRHRGRTVPDPDHDHQDVGYRSDQGGRKTFQRFKAQGINKTGDPNVKETGSKGRFLFAQFIPFQRIPRHNRFENGSSCPRRGSFRGSGL
ncbi:MAG: hypothetical protein KatS3mg105_4539 [Gemmatales bacterium]|nr:MAG: hypothetical protein KatS3mg105_4539 [Gemmatales bacterium]